MPYRKPHLDRQGSFTVEIVMSATILLAGIGVMYSLVPRIGRGWRESRNYQLACHELANQLEVLTALDAASFSDAIANLQVSSEVKDELRDAELTINTSDAEFATRIQLSLAWNRGHESVPLTMVAWKPKQQATQP
jgi:hypothetical protein